MPDSRREQVLAKNKTVLAAIPAFAEFERNRPDDWEPESLPFGHQIDGGEEAIDGAAGEDNFVAAVSVVLGGKLRGEEDAFAMLNRLYAECWKALAADPTLGGLAQDIRLGGLTDPEPVAEEGVGEYAAATMEYSIFYATAEGDPYGAPV